LDYLNEELIDKYYRNEITLKGMAKKVNVPYHIFRAEFRDRGLPSRKNMYKYLNLPRDLAKNLMQKHSGILTRCTIKMRYGHYYKMPFLNALEYADLCNENTELLLKLWKSYIRHNKELKYAISVDRIDTNKGYIVENIQFVPYGFNSWKDNLTPLYCKFKDKEYYAMSKKGLARKTNIPRIYKLGTYYKGHGKNKKQINIEKCSIDKVLENCNTNNLFNYYKKFIQ
jgi:hypothetical protein